MSYKDPIQLVSVSKEMKMCVMYMCPGSCECVVGVVGRTK